MLSSILLPFSLLASIGATRCFNDTQRAKIFKDLEQIGVARGELQAISIDQGTWYTHLLGSSLAKILLTELMGYQVNFVNGTRDIQEVVTRMKGKLVDVNLEVWFDYSDAYKDFLEAAITSGEIIDARQLGTVGRNGWYVPSYVVEQAAPNLNIDFWRAYTTPAVYSYFDKSYRTPWPRFRPFIPEWCAATPEGQTCVEVLASYPEFYAGVLAQIVRNNRFNLTISYVGEKIDQAVNARMVLQQPVLFFYWEPTRFISSNNHTNYSASTSPRGKKSSQFTRITLPDFSQECYANNTANSAGYGSVDCDFPYVLLGKLFGQRLTENERYKDATDFFKKFTIYNTDQDWMLNKIDPSLDARTKDEQQHRAEEIACEWLNSPAANDLVTARPRWYTWVSNTPVEYIAHLNKSFVIVVLAATGFGIACSLAMQVFLFCNRQHPVVKASAHWLCQTLLSSTHLIYIAVIYKACAENQIIRDNCIIFPTLWGAGFVMMFGSIVLKNLRIYWIFKSRVLKKALQRSSNAALLRYLMAMVCGELMLNLGWFAADRPVSVKVKANLADQYAYVYVCTYAHDKAHDFAYMLPKVLLVGYAAVLGYLVWGVHENYNESRKLAFVSYTTALQGAFMLALSFFGVRRDEYFLTQNLLTLLLVANCVGVLIIPQFANVLMARGQQSVLSSDGYINAPDRRQSASSMSQESTTRHGFQSRQQMDALQMRLENQQAEIERLRRLLKQSPPTSSLVPAYSASKDFGHVPQGQYSYTTSRNE